MGKIRVITSLLVTVLLLLGACVPSQETAQPSHEQLNFRLVTDATPGDTDMYDSYIFDLYLEQEQELFLAFSTEGGKVMVSLFTPSKETWGYNPGPGDTTTTTEDGEMGHLEKGRTISRDEGSFRFTIPESGDYLVTIQSSIFKGEIDVQAEYQIQ
jgi:hypothetical protein